MMAAIYPALNPMPFRQNVAFLKIAQAGESSNREDYEVMGIGKAL